MGSLTADPELRFTQSGAAVANFTVASTPRTLDRASGEWKDGEALFLPCNMGGRRQPLPDEMPLQARHRKELTMPRPRSGGVVYILLADGRHVPANAQIADDVRGVDADGDLLVPLLADTTIRHGDGTEHLIPLTPCCHASGKGAESLTGVVCRGCFRTVDDKYGRHGILAVARGRFKLDPVSAGFRRVAFEEFPGRGHMMVVSASWDSVFWLADRHAVVRAGAVELDGAGQRLMEALAEDEGTITFNAVREHDVSKIDPQTPPAQAIATLTDPARIEETLYPPYIADSTKRSPRPYLRPPLGLSYRSAIVLHAKSQEIYWLLRDHNMVEDSEVFATPVYRGTVMWGQTHQTTSHPGWVLAALLDNAN